MNRRSFFSTAVSVLGIVSLARVFKSETGWAKAAKKKSAGGGVGMVMATEESLAGLPKATGVTPANFFEQNDKPTTVQNFCNGGVKGNSACGPKRQPGQFCGSCMFLQERAVYDGNVIGKCQLIPPKPPKDHVWGNYYCATYANNPQHKYEVKG